MTEVVSLFACTPPRFLTSIRRRPTLANSASGHCVNYPTQRHAAGHREISRVNNKLNVWIPNPLACVFFSFVFPWTFSLQWPEGRPISSTARGPSLPYLSRVSSFLLPSPSFMSLSPSSFSPLAAYLSRYPWRVPPPRPASKQGLLLFLYLVNKVICLPEFTENKKKNTCPSNFTLFTRFWS